MQVFVEITSSLGRRVTVIVPTEKFEQAVRTRLQKLSSTAKMDGFRPGKAPQSLIEKRYGLAVRSEVVEILLDSSLREALAQEKLYPAETPVVQSVKAEPGVPFEYNVTFEVYPEVHLHNLSDVLLEKLVVTIEEADVDRVIEQMRTLHATWNEVQRPAEMGDKLNVDMQGLVHGQPSPALHDKNTTLVLDKNTLPPGFEVLEHAKAGDIITINLPDNQHKPAGAAAPADQVLVTVHTVSAPELPPIDADFAKKLGITDGNINSLREEIRQHMQNELGQTLKNRLREQVIDAFLEHHPVELPKGMLASEYQRLEQEVQDKIKQENKSAGDIQLPQAEQQKLQELAQQRVALGLLFPAIIHQQNFKVDDARLSAHVKQMFGAFEDAAQMLPMLLQNKDLMGRLRSQILEDQVVDYLLGQVHFSEKAVNYTEALALSKAGHPGHTHTHRHHPPTDPVRA